MRMRASLAGWRTRARILLAATSLCIASVGAPAQTPPAPISPAQGPPVAPAPGDAPAPAASPAEKQAEKPAEKPRALPAYEARYHNLLEVQTLIDAWIAAESATPATGGARLERVDLPTTQAGLPVPAVQFGAPGTAPLSARPTIFLLGGLDGVSLSGSEAVLAISSALLADAATLPAGVTFVSIPWASPDALTATLSGRLHDGRNALPIDDDGDGRVDEDGPDDLDGDGMILDMLIEDPAGPWTRAADPRFLARARPGDAPRYVLAPEGKDDDHDGRYTEDPPGGIDLDLDFPMGRSSANDARTRALPLQDATTRALADLLLARRSVCVLLFQGNHGYIAKPGGCRRAAWPADADAAVFDALTRLFAHATGRTQARSVTLCEAREAERAGAALDWIYAVPGAMCCEVAVWGPSVEKAPDAKGVAVADALFDNGANAERSSGPPPVSPTDQAWARWLDNTRGGIGFVDWHPVELGDGRRALVGGFEPFSRLNPPAKSLAVTQAGLPAFVQKIASSLPELDLRFDEMKRDGDVCTLRVRAENKGQLPTGLWTTGRWRSARASTPGVLVELVLPQGARLLAGEPRVELGELCGGGASQSVAWIVLAAPGSTLRVKASAPWTSPLEREVKP